MLLLKTVRADGSPCNDSARATGFRWPLTVDAEVECVGWDPTPRCGGGLHGLPWGEGRADCLSADADDVWIVFEAADADVVAVTDDGGGKSKAHRGIVRYVGGRDGAVAYLLEHGAAGKAVVYGTATAGVYGTATAGYRGTATAGDSGTATAGARGQLLLRWYDPEASRYRTVIGYVGEDGIEAGVPYRLDNEHRLVRAAGEGGK